MNEQSALAFCLNYWNDCRMKMRRAPVHMEHYCYDIVCPVCLTEPVDVVLAPFIKPAFFLNLHHVLMGASQKDADGLYLALVYLINTFGN